MFIVKIKYISNSGICRNKYVIELQNIIEHNIQSSSVAFSLSRTLPVISVESVRIRKTDSPLVREKSVVNAARIRAT